MDTLAGLGIDVESQAGVTLDTEARPKKSPRAFCAPVRVPDEVYLVIARIGGRDDYAALFHEAGHTEHYAHMEASLPVEDRYLGDNSITEGFAFLFEHLTDDPAWLERILGVDDPGEVVRHAEAVKLVRPPLLRQARLRARAARRRPAAGRAAGPLLRAARLGRPRRLAAHHLARRRGPVLLCRYLRAWALETHLRRALSERFGPAWFAEPAAGDLLSSLWRPGQRHDADELLAELSGEQLALTALA